MEGEGRGGREGKRREGGDRPADAATCSSDRILRRRARGADSLFAASSCFSSSRVIPECWFDPALLFLVFITLTSQGGSPQWILGLRGGGEAEVLVAYFGKIPSPPESLRLPFFPAILPSEMEGMEGVNPW